MGKTGDTCGDTNTGETDQGVTQIAQFGREGSSCKILGGSKLLPFKNRGPSMLQTFLVPFPRSVH